MRIIILGNKAAETIKKHIVSVWDNIDVLTYKSVDLFAQDLENRSIACDRVIITEEVLPTAETLQVVKDFLEEHYMSIQIIVILKSEDKHAVCTEICYDERNSVVFCMSTMKANFVKDLPMKSITELRTAYADNVYTAPQVQELEQNVYDVSESVGDFVADEFTEDYADESFINDSVDNLQGEDFENFEGSEFGDFVEDTSTEVTDEDNFETDFTDYESVSEDFVSDLQEQDYAAVSEGFTDLDEDFDTLPEMTTSAMRDSDADVTNSYLNDMEFTEDDDSLEDTYETEDVYSSEGIVPIADNESMQGVSNIIIDDYLPDDYNFETVVRNFDVNEENIQEAQTNVIQTQPVEETVQVQGNSIQTTRTQNIRRSTNSTNNVVVNTSGKAQVNVNTHNMAGATSTVKTDITSNKRKNKLFGGKSSSKQNTSAIVGSTQQAALYSQAGTKYVQTMNGQAMSIIIVTGDRRSGVTNTAFQMANHFASKVPTLYVDYDIVRRGSVFQLSLDSLLRCTPEVQNGLGVLRVGKKVSNVAYKPPNCEFDALVSIPNYALSDETLVQTQTQLLYQREYNAVIIDCPFDHLYLLSDVISVASIYICINGDLISCSSTILELDRLNPVSKQDSDKRLSKEECEMVSRGVTEKDITMVIRALSTKDVVGVKTRLTEKDISMLSRGQYIITGSGMTEQQFLLNMQYLSKIYNLGTTSINWALLRIAGTQDNLIGILQNLL